MNEIYNKNCLDCHGWGSIYLSDDCWTTCDCKYEKINKMKILFGKHKGTYFKELPIDYLKWCYEKEIFLSRNEIIHDYIFKIIDKYDPLYEIDNS